MNEEEVDRMLRLDDEAHRQEELYDAFETLREIQKLVDNEPEGETMKDLGRLDACITRVSEICNQFLHGYMEEYHATY